MRIEGKAGSGRQSKTESGWLAIKKRKKRRMTSGRMDIEITGGKNTTELDKKNGIYIRSYMAVIEPTR